MSENKKEPIVFKSEDSLWQLLAEGKKSWDDRLWDFSDVRICRLAWGHVVLGPWTTFSGSLGYPRWEPAEPLVIFVNKATGAWLEFRYLGMEFTPWAPGWVFLRLGGIVRRGDRLESIAIKGELGGGSR